eukprot:2523336-Pleurochrysis_carterae.AAC.2
MRTGALECQQRDFLATLAHGAPVEQAARGHARTCTVSGWMRTVFAPYASKTLQRMAHSPRSGVSQVSRFAMERAARGLAAASIASSEALELAARLAATYEKE